MFSRITSVICSIFLMVLAINGAAFTANWMETSFEDFADGTFSNGGVSIYSTADGSIKFIGQQLDVNGDGYMDIVFSNNNNDSRNDIDSYIYLGSAAGFSNDNKIDLPTQGARGNSIADLNDDGHLDIIFSNHHSGSTFNVNSYIYWGSTSGFSNDNKTELPTRCGTDNSIADLNHDGYLDIVFSNKHNNYAYQTNSYIYWGSAAGFSNDNKSELSTYGATDNSIGDLDADGYLDIIFSNTHNDTSYIYWGSISGFSNENKTELPTHGASGNSIADLNHDGYLDIVFSNQYNNSTHNINSYIYWGSASGFSNENKTELPTHSALGNSIADLNVDGYPDIVFSNEYNNSTSNIDSYIYWGSASGFSSDNRTELPTHGAHLSTTADLGDVHNRGREIVYTSSVHNFSNPPNFGSISWTADTPLNTAVEFQLRSANTEAEFATAQWYGPTNMDEHYTASDTSINPVHNDDRLVQYRAFLLLSDPIGLATPALHKVSIEYQNFPVGDVSGDGDVSAYDASLILQYVVGLITEFPVESMMASENAVPCNYTLSIPALSVKSGGAIIVPVEINEASVVAGCMTLRYDASVLHATEVTSKMSGVYWESGIINDSICIAFARVKPAESGAESLFYIKFEDLANRPGTTAEIEFDHVQLAESVSIATHNGSITVLPDKFALLQNYPNPFNPETWIPFQLVEKADVLLSIYDAGGNLIRSINLSEKPAGVYVAKERAVYWDGKNATGEEVSSGVYFYHLQAGDYKATRRMSIVNYPPLKRQA